MKRKLRLFGMGLLIGIGLLILLVGGALYLRQVTESTFEVEGRVAGFGGETTAYVEHGEVAGHLPARTTPLEAKDPAQLDSLEMGDAVRFKVAAGSDRLRITGARKLPDNALPRNPASAGEAQGAPAGKSTVENGPAVQVGERVSDLELTNQDGEKLRLSDYRGRALVLTFIYTSCPMPDMCPLMSQRFAALQPKLKARYGREAQLLSISFDPENDTPQVLSDYAKKYTGDLSTWTFATGATPKQQVKAEKAFGITAMKKEGQIVHNLVTALVGPDGRLVWMWRGNDWAPGDILQVAEQTLEDSKQKASQDS